VDPGFQPENVLTMQIGLDFTKYNTGDKQRAFFESFLDKIQTQSGVKSAAASMMIPLNGTMRMTGDFQLEGQTPVPGQKLPVADFRVVSESYFDTLHIPILQGRGFTRADRPGVPDVAVVNRTAARHYWGTQDPVGKRFSADNGQTWTPDRGSRRGRQAVRIGTKMRPMKSTCPWRRTPLMDAGARGQDGSRNRWASRVDYRIAVRGGSQTSLLRACNRLSKYAPSRWRHPRLTANLLSLFALLALTIAATGIGGVMALAVGQRRHEIGVRMAIGARPERILRMVLGQGMVLALFGVALGLVGALALTRLLQRLLFEVGPTDPLTFVSVAVVLSTATLVACYVPARRAAQVDPIIALRVE